MTPSIRSIAGRPAFHFHVSPVTVALPALVLLALFPSARADTVVLKDGMKVTGRVVDPGGNSIELRISAGASRRILLRDIEKVTFDIVKEAPGKALDKVVRKDGSDISGDVSFSEDGKGYVVARPDGSRVEIPREDVLRVISRDQVGAEGGGVYSEKVRESVKTSIAKVAAGGAEASPAEDRLKTCGIFAIADVREALKKAKPGSPAAEGFARVVRLYRLKEVTQDSLQELPDYYRTFSPAASVNGEKAVGEKCQMLVQMFTRYVNESVPVAKFLVLDPGEDHKVRAVAIALLGQNGYHRDLIEIYNDPAGGQIQLAAAIALARNRLLAGAECLIQALELDRPEVREVAFNALKGATGKDFGFGVHDTPSARKEAIARWKGWWAENRATIQAQTADLLSGRSRPEDSEERRKALKLWQEGCAELDKKKFENAENKLRAAVQTDPTFFNAQVSLANLLFLHREKGDEGRRILEDLLGRKIPEIGPQETTWIRYDLGRAFEIAGKLDKAGLEYQAALSTDPKFFRAAMALGDLMFRQATCSMEPPPPNRRALLGDAMTRYNQAIALIEEYSNGLAVLSITDLPPETPPAFERQVYNRGIVDLKASLRLQRSQARFALAKIRDLQEERPRAILELTSAIETLGDDREGGAREFLVKLHDYRGHLLEEAGENAGALKDYRAVIRSDLDPKDPTALEGIRRLEPRSAGAPSKGAGPSGGKKGRPKRRAAAEDR